MEHSITYTGGMSASTKKSVREFQQANRQLSNAPDHHTSSGTRYNANQNLPGGNETSIPMCTSLLGMYRLLSSLKLPRRSLVLKVATLIMKQKSCRKCQNMYHITSHHCTYTPLSVNVPDVFGCFRKRATFNSTDIVTR